MKGLFATAAVAVLLTLSAAAQIRVIADVDFVAGAEYPNRKDRLDIYLPERTGPTPVIVSFYGGGLRAGDKSEPGQVQVGRHFAAAGIVTVVANYRLSPAVTHPAHVQDAAAAVAWVKRNIASYGGDPDNVFVIGHSAGAYLAALLATDPQYLRAHGLEPGDVRGFAPVSAFFYVDRPGVAPDRPKDTWGTDANVWKAASPGTHVAPQAPPLLLLFADGDDGWRRQQQKEFADAMKAKGNQDVDVKMIAGRTHNSIWTEMAAGEDDTSQAILQFVRRLARPTSRSAGR
jgi:acetyl esterase/lipase